MRSTGVTLLALLLLVGLAGIGTGYALWSKTLDISGTVGTADLNVEFVPGHVFSNDDGTSIDPGKDKHVGMTHCEINAGDPQIVDVTVENAYPSYQALCSLKWENTGTLPARLCSLDCPTAPDWLSVEVQNTLGEVRDPGEQASGMMDLHVEQTAPQGGSAAFLCEFQFQNWNEPCD